MYLVSHWGHAFSNGLHAGKGIVNKVERTSTSTIISTSTSASATTSVAACQHRLENNGKEPNQIQEPDLYLSRLYVPLDTGRLGGGRAHSKPGTQDRPPPVLSTVSGAYLIGVVHGE